MVASRRLTKISLGISAAAACLVPQEESEKIHAEPVSPLAVVGKVVFSGPPLRVE